MKSILIAAVLCTVGSVVLADLQSDCAALIIKYNQELTTMGCPINYGCAVTGTCPRPPQPTGACYDPGFGNADPTTCRNICIATQMAYNNVNPGNQIGQACEQCNQVPVAGQCACYACKNYVLLQTSANINNIYNALSECQGTNGQPDITQCTCNYFFVGDSPRTNYQENCNNCYESGSDQAALNRMKGCACCHRNLAYNSQDANKAYGYGPYDTTLTNLSGKCQQWTQQAQACKAQLVNNPNDACKTQEGYRTFAAQQVDGAIKWGKFLTNEKDPMSQLCLDNL